MSFTPPRNLQDEDIAKLSNLLPTIEAVYISISSRISLLRQRSAYESTNESPKLLEAYESIPLTLSSAVEDTLMEAIIRYDDRIAVRDLWPSTQVLTINQINKKVSRLLKSGVLKEFPYFHRRNKNQRWNVKKQQSEITGAGDRARDREWLQMYITENMEATEVSPKSADAALDVLQHTQICNTVTVCCLMRSYWGELQYEDIAKAAKSPTDHRSDLFGVLSCFERWRKVRDKYIERGYIRDTSDGEENAAREIWDQAMKELDKQG
ncbi:hypothetical protein BDR22DRAFT_894436 [Usnea florida]